MTDTITIPKLTAIQLIEFLEDAIEDYGPCDHSVGLCICDMYMLRDEMKKAVFDKINEEG